MFPLDLDIFAPLVIEHPLREEPGERLAEADQAEVVHHLHEEPGVEQVEDRVLDPADVLVDRQPVVDDLAAERQQLVGRVGVAEEVPGRVDERVHRVRLARASAPQPGHVVRTQSSAAASGDRPFGL